jgi:hypothetical protein
MADEITITIKGQVINGNLRDTFTPGTLKYNQGDKAAYSNVVTTTSETTGVALDLGSASTRAGWFFYRHLADTTASIYVGSVVGTSFMTFSRIQPGGSGVFELMPGTSYSVSGSTSDTVYSSLHYLVLST